MNKNSTVGKLPYPCKEVLELYGMQKKETAQLEKLKGAFIKTGIKAEMYYSNKEELSYATLVVFLPWNFHIELSKFDSKAFRKWHTSKKLKIKTQKLKIEKQRLK